MKALLLIGLFFTVNVFMSLPVHRLVAVGSNRDVAGESAPDHQRVEPTIAVDPRNPSILVAGAQDLRLENIGLHRWHGYYRSTDGGQTWSSSLLPGFPTDQSNLGRQSPLFGSNATSDPVLAFDANGNVYYIGISFNISSAGALGPAVAFVAKYVNDGGDYSGTTLVQGTKFADKPWIAVDTTTGPNRGNVYVGFDGIINGRFALLFTRSTDGGRSFSTPMRVSNQDGLSAGLTVDRAGNVFVSSLSPGNSIQHVAVAKSTNGGVTFEPPVFVAMVDPLPSRGFPGNGFRVFTIPQITSDSRGIYLVWDSFAGDQANIFFSRSTDSGRTWTSPLMINDSPLGVHFFPTVAASNGIVSIAWYDSRLGQLPNGTITGLNVFYAISTNVGASFSANLRLSSTSFNPNLVRRTDAPGTIAPFIGDYISITASPEDVHPIWTDNSNACDTIDPRFGCVDQDALTVDIKL